MSCHGAGVIDRKFGALESGIAIQEFSRCPSREIQNVPYGSNFEFRPKIMSFQRGRLDVLIPVLAVLSCIMLPLSIGTSFQEWRDMDHATPVPGRVTSVNDRPPYAAKKDSYSLEYPIVEYVDHEGFTRHLMPYSGVLPGYFRTGQSVTVGRIGIDYFILDRWYVWQEHIVGIPLFSIWIFAAIGYYTFWRPRMIAEEKTNK